MVVPCLTGHLQGNEHAYHGSDGTCHGGVLDKLLQQVSNAGHTHTNPDGKGVERGGIGIVALTGLHGCLVQVEHDGKARHEEEHEHYPELACTTLAASGLPEEADEAEQQGQAIEDVAALVVAQL